jgi:hypothetical protein
LRERQRGDHIAALFLFLLRHCERSEAIHGTPDRGSMDCFVAEHVIGPRIRADPLAPRNDGLGGPPPSRHHSAARKPHSNLPPSCRV